MTKKNLPGIPDLEIGNIFCIGRNYVEHAHELKSDIPDEPLVFLKPTSSVIFDGSTIHLPAQSQNVHHEVELVVALGKGGNDIPQNQALKHIAGYAIGIDVTARDIQQKAKDKSHPWTVAKGFDTFAPLSSFIPAASIENPQNLDLKIKVNDEVRQSDNTGLMIFPVAELISYLSGIFRLQPGDLIFTGTPRGVSPIVSSDRIRAFLNDNLATLSVSVE